MTHSQMDTSELSLSQLPPPGVEWLQSARIAPIEPDDADLSCGVFRADGSFCPMSRSRFAPGRFTGIPPAPTAAAPLPGRFMFGGVARHHFGHFLLECTARLWAAAQEPGLDGVVFIANPRIDFDSVLHRRFGAFLDVLCGGLPVLIIAQPTEVEELLIPAPGFGHGAWSVGTPVFRDFIRARLQDAAPPEGPERLYISRRQLRRKDQAIDQEAVIEAMMQDAGYTIFHPQQHKLLKQCQRYMAAKTIVGGDGSAFHLAACTMQPGAHVGLIQRRLRQAPVDTIAAQIRAFADVDLHVINPIVPQGQGTPPPISLAALQQALGDAGFI